jgi:hypothetical protein
MLKTIFSLDKRKYNYQPVFFSKNTISRFYSNNNYNYNSNYNSSENSGNNNMNNPNNKKKLIITLILGFYFIHLKNR